MATDPFLIERILAEGAVPLHALRREAAPSRGRARTLGTLVKWATEGVGGVKLEAYHDGTRWFSSRLALARFLAALTGREEARAERSAAPVPEARRAAYAERLKADIKAMVSGKK